LIVGRTLVAATSELPPLPVASMGSTFLALYLAVLTLHYALVVSAKRPMNRNRMHAMNKLQSATLRNKARFVMKREWFGDVGFPNQSDCKGRKTI